MVQLSTSLLLAVAALSPLAAAWPKDTCHQPMYKDMWHYRNHGPAKEFCHKHHPAPTVTKTRYPGCITKTQSECHETTTVTHTRTIRCHTTHTGKQPTSVYPVPYSQHTPRAAEPEAAAAPAAAPAAETMVAAAEKREAWGGWGGEAGGWGGEGHGWEGGRPWGGWGDAGHGWSHKHDGLKHCGYDCVQKGCHCMRGGETKTSYTTAKPTCTKTTTRGYTKTITHMTTVSGYNCMHGGVHGYPNHRPEGGHPPGHYGGNGGW